MYLDCPSCLEITPHKMVDTWITMSGTDAQEDRSVFLIKCNSCRYAWSLEDMKDYYGKGKVYDR